MTQPEPERREERDSDGALIAEFFVVTVNGRELRHGEFTAWFPNGQRREYGFYDMGVRRGLWMGWHDDGRRLYDTNYDEPELAATAPEPDEAAWREPPPPVEPDPQAQRKYVLWIELAVVLLLVWLPFMVAAATEPQLFVDRETRDALVAASVEQEPIYDDWHYSWIHFPMIAGHLQVLAPLLLILWWRRREFSPASVGWVRPRWIRDLGGGAALFVVSTGLSWLLLLAFPDDGFFFHEVRPAAWFGLVVMTVNFTLNSVMEELVWRGYMLQRLSFLTGSGWLAILVSSALFASYHVYQGPNAGLAIFVWALIYCLAFRLIKSLWPLVVAHTAHNVSIDAGFFDWLGI